MEIIDELEPTARGPYTGALGYLGFNRESQISMTSGLLSARRDRYFHAGAGIVADSMPAAEYDETVAKAWDFLPLWASRILPILGQSVSEREPARITNHLGFASKVRVQQLRMRHDCFPQWQICSRGSGDVSVFDRGFLYGDGLFEGYVSINGKFFRWGKHIRTAWKRGGFLANYAALSARNCEISRPSWSRGINCRIHCCGHADARDWNQRGYSPKERSHRR